QLGVDLVSLRQQVIQIGLPQDRTKRRLGNQRGSTHEVEHLDDRLLGINHAKVDDRVDLHGDVVAGDCLLRWHVQRHDPQVDFAHRLDAGDDEEQPRASSAHQATEAEDYAPLVLLDDFDSRGGQHEQDDNDDYEPD